MKRMTNLKKLRIAAGLTQEELAQKAGVNRYTVYETESGHSFPCGYTMIVLCKALGKTLDEVWGDLMQEVSND